MPIGVWIHGDIQVDLRYPKRPDTLCTWNLFTTSTWTPYSQRKLAILRLGEVILFATNTHPSIWTWIQRRWSALRGTLPPRQGDTMSADEAMDREWGYMGVGRWAGWLLWYFWCGDYSHSWRIMELLWNAMSWHLGKAKKQIKSRTKYPGNLPLSKRRLSCPLGLTCSIFLIPK